MPALHEHQLRAVDRALAAPSRRWLFNSECGVGKTPEALVAALKCAPLTMLIVTPAIVRLNWLRELEVWWNPWIGKPTFEVGIIDGTRDAKGTSTKERARLDAAYLAPIQIVSYNLVSELATNSQFDVIILDECHRLANGKAGWSRHIGVLVANNPQAAVFGLTGTLIPNAPLDAWNVLHTIWPGRFGTRWKFGERYCNKLERRWVDAEGEEQVRTSFEGIREEHVEELRERLAAISSRTTKAEVAHLLPAFDVRTLTIRGDRQAAINEWLEDAVTGSTHVAVLTYYKDSATRLADALSRKHTVIHIDGTLPPQQRIARLDDARSSANCVLVATLDSVGIGIDMTFCNQALFLEPREIEPLIQGLGRFSRLSGKLPSTCTVAAQEGTQEEADILRLGDKLREINAAIKPGVTEDALSGVFEGLNMVGADWQERFAAIAASMPQEDAYGL